MADVVPEPRFPPIVVVMDDPVVRGRIEDVARDLEIALLGFRSVEECRLPAPPRAFVVDLSLDGALDAVASWKGDFPGAAVVGVLSVPDPELWASAESAGADFVCTRGTVHRVLPEHLEAFATREGGLRRIRVAPMREFEGRLGYVGRVTDDVPEEIALYHIGYEICAVSDICPHAGARLSEGELSGDVITCPKHGSQFGVCSGERFRGPADDPLRTYRVVVEEGSVFLEFEE